MCRSVEQAGSRSRPRSRRLSPLRLRSDRRVARSPSRLGSSVGVASLRWVSAHCRHAVDSNGTSSISASGLSSQSTVSRVSGTWLVGAASRSASPRGSRAGLACYIQLYTQYCIKWPTASCVLQQCTVSSMHSRQYIQCAGVYTYARIANMWQGFLFPTLRVPRDRIGASEEHFHLFIYVRSSMRSYLLQLHCICAVSASPFKYTSGRRRSRPAIPHRWL